MPLPRLISGCGQHADFGNVINLTSVTNLTKRAVTQCEKSSWLLVSSLWWLYFSAVHTLPRGGQLLESIEKHGRS